MNIPPKNIVKVYSNKKWSNFLYIGSFDVIYGSMGIQVIQYKFPENPNDIGSWGGLNDALSPVDLLNHLFQIENELKENESLELYGETFYSNYLNVKPEIEKFKSLLLNDMDSFIEENILWVDKGESINFDTKFYWHSNYDWARRDPDCVILFDEEMDGFHAVYLNESIYHQVIDLLENIWTNILKNEI